MPGSPAHLFYRFFDVLTSRGLDPSERSAVSNWLDEPLSALFFSQPSADQRHGYEAALSVIGAGGHTTEVITAALLHDVAKRHSGLGIIGRSLASILIILRLPLTTSMKAYRDHGIVGASELDAANAAPLAVDFARHHHGERPATIEPAIWAMLIEADQPPKARSLLSGRISSETT